MSEIRVLAHGLDREEAPGTIINRPTGTASFSLIRFHSPIEVLTSLGLMDAEPGNCILLAPRHPHYYRGTAGQWINDWMHFTGDKAEFYTAKYGVPHNTLLTPHRTDFLAPIFEEIAKEEQFKSEGWQDAVELLMYQLLFQLGRELKKQKSLLSSTQAEHLSALRVLRQHLHCDLARPWTVNEMANSVGLSASRFAALYQQFFGVSPVEDLLRTRMRYAKYLLTNGTGLVSNIARECGYENVNYFTTLFHKRVGCSPSDYQRRTRIIRQNDADTAPES